MPQWGPGPRDGLNGKGLCSSSWPGHLAPHLCPPLSSSKCLASLGLGEEPVLLPPNPGWNRKPHTCQSILGASPQSIDVPTPGGLPG